MKLPNIIVGIGSASCNNKMPLSCNVDVEYLWSGTFGGHAFLRHNISPLTPRKRIFELLFARSQTVTFMFYLVKTEYLLSVHVASTGFSLSLSSLVRYYQRNKNCLESLAFHLLKKRELLESLKGSAILAREEPPWKKKK